jgi:hypothetical protein
MRVYTVHEPPPKRDETSADPSRFQFVRDGFSFWAFLFGPLWMLRHRMWLVLLGYIGVVIVLEVIQHLLGVSTAVSSVVGLLLALLVGFEAPTLRRFTLGRRRYTNLGVIVGDDLVSAERRFFDAWAKGGAPSLALEAAGAPPSAATDVIGLFPQPGAQR